MGHEVRFNTVIGRGHPKLKKTTFCDIHRESQVLIEL